MRRRRPRAELGDRCLSSQASGRTYLAALSGATHRVCAADAGLSTLATVDPETRYARSGDVQVAYQVVGDGPRDLLLVPGVVSHLELCWDYPPYERFMRRLAEFA